MELLLFRLGDRGYASPRERVREVVDEVVRVLRYDPAVCGPGATRASGYVTPASRPSGAAGC
jgi:hypothetical protein